MRLFTTRCLAPLICTLVALATLVYAQQELARFSWGNVNITSTQQAMQEVPQGDTKTQLLQNNARIPHHNYHPQDVIIGALESDKAKSVITRLVLQRIRSFVRDMQEKKIQETLKEHVVSDSMVLISRQITKARQYAKRVDEVRIGVVRMGDGQERHVRVRILGREQDFNSHAVLRMYFAKEESTWKISTIEGTFDTLLEPYKPSGPFSPTGTLGITQTL